MPRARSASMRAQSHFSGLSSAVGILSGGGFLDCSFSSSSSVGFVGRASVRLGGCEGKSGVGVGEIRGASGLGGRRFEDWRMRSGGMVRLPCLKTYFAMEEAKIAGFVAVFVTAPFAFAALDSFVALSFFVC